MGDLPPARAEPKASSTPSTGCAGPGERLLVGPGRPPPDAWYSDTFFYYMFPELPPATQFMEMDPGMADPPRSPLADEVASSDWVLLTAFWAGWPNPNTAMNFGPDAPNEVVRSQFCLVQSFENDLVPALPTAATNRCPTAPPKHPRKTHPRAEAQQAPRGSPPSNSVTLPPPMWR